MVSRVYTYSKFLYINWISIKLKKTGGLVVGVEMDIQVFPNEKKVWEVTNAAKKHII